MNRGLCYEVWLRYGQYGSLKIAAFYVYSHAERFIGLLHNQEEISIVDRNCG